MKISSDLVQSIGIIVTLIITLFQLIQHRKDLRSAMITTISERNDSLLQDITNNWRAIKNFSKPFNHKQSNLFSDPRVSLMYRVINFFDEMFHYYQQGYINKGTWELYQTTLNNFFTERFPISFWNHVRYEYNEELQRIVDEVISRHVSSEI